MSHEISRHQLQKRVRLVKRRQCRKREVKLEVTLRALQEREVRQSRMSCVPAVVMDRKLRVAQPPDLRGKYAGRGCAPVTISFL
jgi:hypothetical protein